MSSAIKRGVLIIALGTMLGVVAYIARAYKEPLNSETLHSLIRTESLTFDSRTKLSGCVLDGAYPDHACTPGDIFPLVTKDDVCRSGYSQSARDVSFAKKEAIYAAYGIATHTQGQYEVDHLVSLELGGSNDASNLFPQAALPRPGFHEKDEVENYLHEQVCTDMLSLREAQILIGAHWLDVYRLMH